MGDSAAGINEQAFRTIFAHRTMLRAYILAIVRESHRAEDVLSDTVVALAQEWNRYDSTRPFAPWARGVARRIALARVRKDATGPVLLDDAALESIGPDLDRFGDQARLQERKDALQRCLDHLAPPNRRLIEWRYFENRTMEETARLASRSMNALYVAFSRLHTALHDCVERRLNAPEPETRPHG
jgi:RNA polymerase sigma-70 factor (ECF subfamily)